MDKVEYARKLGECLKTTVFANADNSITWCNYHDQNGMMIAISYKRETDFSEESLKRDIEFLKRLIVENCQQLENFSNSVLVAELC
jgi:hypothetical protein